jgi:hypothetical protein
MSSNKNKLQQVEYKKTLVSLPPILFEISIGVLLGDSNLYLAKKGASLKFEQGLKNKIYLFHLFQQYEKWTFRSEPYIRKSTKDKTIIHSYSFQTFTHQAFFPLWNLFMSTGKKKR